MTDKVYPYFAEAILDDDSVRILDLEEHGWADKEMLARVRRWTLADKATGMPVIAVQIPEGGKPVFKSRFYGALGAGGQDLTEVAFRCFGVGYKLGRRTHWFWVLPGGVVEVGESPVLADMLWRARVGAPEV